MKSQISYFKSEISNLKSQIKHPSRRLASLACALFLAFAGLNVSGIAWAADAPDFQVVPGFFKVPQGWTLGGCSAVSTNSKGEIYLFHRGLHPIICFDAKGNYLRSFGDDVIEMAHGLRVDRDDNVWVTDIGGNRVYQFDPTGKVLKSLGSGKAGSGPHHFNKPTDIAFGPDGEFYVSDGYGNNRVVKFSPSGAFVKSFGTSGRGKSQFNLPHSIVMDSKNRLLVGDRENNRIQIFDREGKPLDSWTGFAPYGLALSRDGQLFVADGRANKVLLLDETGKIVGSWGQEGTNPGEFKMPHMLTIDDKGNLLVAEVDGLRLQKFAEVKGYQQWPHYKMGFKLLRPGFRLQQLQLVLERPEVHRELTPSAHGG